MSLINQMLKDLERRRPRGPDAPNAPLRDLHGVDAPRRRHGRRYGYLLGGAAIALVLLAALLLIVQRHPSSPAASPVDTVTPSPHRTVTSTAPAASPTVSAPVQAAPAPRVPAPSKPARVRDVRLSTHGPRNRLVFDLSAPVQQRLSTHDHGRRIVIELADTGLAEPLPTLTGAGSPIDSVRSTERGRGLHIELAMKRPVQIESFALESDATHGHRLVIDFTAAAAVVARSTPRPPAAAPAPSLHGNDHATDQPLMQKKPLPLSPAQRAELAYRQGSEQLRKGAYTDAEASLRAALALNPRLYRAREALAALLINTGRAGAAREVLAQGLRLDPGYAPFAALYARLLVNQGEVAQAAQALERASPDMTAQPGYYAFLAALYQRLGRYAQAAQLYQRVLQLRPQNGVWWMGLGISLEGEGNGTAALQAYTQARDSGNLAPKLLSYVNERIAALDKKTP
ncbi:MAG: tetratricopeptide repeat protein [Gammaproteobacteria bacterium]|nr:tetratricopeptide repeat protein [Gammaproteobacteria bacterium]